MATDSTNIAELTTRAERIAAELEHTRLELGSLTDQMQAVLANLRGKARKVQDLTIELDGVRGSIYRASRGAS